MTGGVISGDRVISGEELADRAARAAYGLTGLGIRTNDAIALLLRNDYPLFEASRAAALLGAFSVPINWHFGPDEVLHILNDSRAKVLVVHSDLLKPLVGRLPTNLSVLVAETPAEITSAYRLATRNDDTALQGESWEKWLECQPPYTDSAATLTTSVIYTSGTTGKPKGVVRVAPSEEAAIKVAASINQLYDIQASARTAITGPMYHSALNTYALGMAAVGASVWLMPRFDAESLLRMIQNHRLTHLHLVPIMFVRLLKLPPDVRSSYDVSSLQHVVHAAAPCPIDVKRRMIDWWGPIIHEYYGSTETRAIVSCNSEEWLAHPGSVGRALPETSISILDEAGRSLANGEVGEIYARNFAVEDFTYVGDSDARARIEKNGLVTAGDVGYLDKDGFLFLCDRRKDMVNSAGVNIYPAEIEACLLELPGVQDCAVFGIPDDEYGESIAAVIQAMPGAVLDKEAVRSHVRSHLAGYKVPKLVDFLNSLPREDSGKILKRKLRDRYWSASGRRI